MSISKLATILSLALSVASSLAAGRPSHAEFNDTAEPAITIREEIIYWTALGDSFAAGPGAGEPYDAHGDPSRECHAFSNSYPAQLARLPVPGPAVNFLACTGDVTDDVMSKQLRKWDNKHEQEFVTLSIGGNDALFGKILTHCVFQPSPISSYDCDKTIAESKDIIENKLPKAIQDVYLRITAMSHPKQTTIYHTLYDNFFNADTDWCNDKSMGVLLKKPKLTRELRGQLNELVNMVNNQISHVAIYHNNPEHPEEVRSKIRIVAPDNRFDGHRFCEEHHKDFDHKGIYFFKLDLLNSAAAATGDKDSAAKDSSQADIELCDGVDELNDADRAISCGIAVHNNQTLGKRQTLRPRGAGARKVFHPTSEGFEEIAAEVMEVMGSAHWPEGTHLRPLPLGDSITLGFQDPEHNGYRGELQTLLKRGNNDVDFLGSQKSGSMDDNDHEGHSGYTIAQIADVARKNALRKRTTGGQTPNVILLHAGTNDMNKPEDPDTAHLRMGSLIDQLLEDYPSAAIIVSQIIPSTNKDTMKRIRRYNALVASEVQSRRQKGKHVWFAWMSITDDMLADGLHPNSKGYKTMAAGWAEALAQVQVEGWIKKPSQGGGPGEGGKCDKLPTWIKQGEIANGAGLGKEYFPGSTCNEAISDPDEKYCDCYLDDGTEYRVDRGDNKCSEFNYLDVNAVQFADLNGDGLDEYLWVDKNGSVTAFQNMGHEYGDSTHGTVNWWPRGMIASGIGSLVRREEIRFADLNGDGRADYIRVHYDGSVTAYLNMLDGTDVKNIVWVEQGKIAAGIGRTGSGVRFADLNGDGRAEYLYVDTMGAVTCYLNGGYKYIDSKHGEVGWIEQGQIATGVPGSTKHNVRFADINGDGKADYLVIQGNGKGGALLWQNMGGPDDGPNAGKVKWWERGLIASGPGDRTVPGYNVVFADFNGDGRDEYTWINPETSAVDMWLNSCQFSGVGVRAMYSTI